MENEVLECGVVMDEGVEEVGDGGGEVIGDEDAKCESKTVRSECFPLVETVGLVVGEESIEELDEGGGGGAIVANEVEEEEMVEGVAVGEPTAEKNSVDELTGGGSVGVLNVEGAMGDRGRAKVDFELLSSSGGFEARRDEAVLVEGKVEGTRKKGKTDGDEAGDEAANARVWVASGRAAVT